MNSTPEKISLIKFFENKGFEIFEPPRTKTPKDWNTISLFYGRWSERHKKFYQLVKRERRGRPRLRKFELESYQFEISLSNEKITVIVGEKEFIGMMDEWRIGNGMAKNIGQADNRFSKIHKECECGGYVRLFTEKCERNPLNNKTKCSKTFACNGCGLIYKDLK